MTDLADQIKKLSPAKRALLEQKLNQFTKVSPSTSPISQETQQEEQIPLSFAQERIWFLEQLMSGNYAYHRPLVLNLKGKLDIAHLTKCLEAIIQHHAILRTSFHQSDADPPYQKTHPYQPLTLPFTNLMELPKSAREPELWQQAMAELKKPFDLAQGSALHIHLFQTALDSHVLLIIFHHIVSDGWSDRIFLEELVQQYQTVHTDNSYTAPPLPIQYTDFALWQRKWFQQSDVISKQVDYWKRKLQPPISVLELPIDYPRPATRSYRGASFRFQLSSTLTTALAEVSRQESATQFMVLLATFKILLYQYTRQSDLFVTTPVANRTRKELEGLIGFFVNNLVLRSKLSPLLTFSEFLQQVRKTCLEAYAHQDLPIEKLVQALRLKRDFSHSPLVQAAFTLESRPINMEITPDLQLTCLAFDTNTAKTDISLSMQHRPDGLVGICEYSTDLFRAQTIEKMMSHYCHLLEAVVAQPIKLLSQLPAPSTVVNALDHDANLTRSQLLVWMGQKLQPEVPLYNIAVAFTINRTIEFVHFERAFHVLIQASDTLRTVLEEVEDFPQLRILDQLPFNLELIQLADTINPRDECKKQLEIRCCQIFDLSTRLFDSALFQLADDKFVWYFCYHHLLADGWSTWLIAKAIGQFYEQSRYDTLSPSPQLPSYLPYIEQEREYYQSQRYKEAQAYWHNALSDAKEAVAFYGNTPKKQTANVQRFTQGLGRTRSQQLRLFAHDDLTLLSVFAVLLTVYTHHISGSRYISLGIPFHNRRSSASREVIGLFMEVYPLTVHVEEQDTFTSLLSQVKQLFIEALSHTPYAISNPSNQTHYDLFLNLQTLGNYEFLGAPVQVEWLHTAFGNDSFALQVHDFGEEGEFTLDFDLHEDVFDAGQHHWVRRHFSQVVDAFLQNPQQVVSKVSLISDFEAAYLQQLNPPLASPIADQTIMTLFETRVASTPNAIAVIFNEATLTYLELNQRANQLARYLQSQGVVPETIVGIHLHRSTEMIVAILAVLKAGGAYLPLDPTYPPDRLEFMLADAQPTVLLSQRTFTNIFTTDQVEKVINLDDWSVIAQYARNNLASCVSADNLAYMIYTSGSTGRPKGVMVTHGNFLNAYLGWEKIYNLGKSPTSHLQMASFSFDVFGGDLVRALCSGGRLVLCPAAWLLEPDRLYQLMKTQKVTHAEFVPAVLRFVVKYVLETEQSFEFMQCLIVGSDLWHVGEYQQVQALCGSATRHVNSYGITETTIDSLYFEDDVATLSPGRIVPVGRPLTNTAIYILDRQYNPVPIGVPGELYISGSGVARGYFGDPRKTAVAYIPNPFAPGERLYKSGDIARCLPNGSVELLGRMDRQIKIRGRRMETGEIEAVLKQYTGVGEAIVVVREDIPGDKQLVAYLDAVESETLTPAALRQFLQTKLPPYMVPSNIVFLDAIPLTANGKINFRKLPAPNKERSTVQDDYVPPHSEMEKVLTEIWSQALNVRIVGIHDNFFELGGDSILLVQLRSRLNNTLQSDLSIVDLFKYPTIHALANQLSQQQGTSSTPVAELADLPVQALRTGRERLREQRNRRKQIN